MRAAGSCLGFERCRLVSQITSSWVPYLSSHPGRYLSTEGAEPKECGTDGVTPCPGPINWPTSRITNLSENKMTLQNIAFMRKIIYQKKQNSWCWIIPTFKVLAKEKLLSKLLCVFFFHMTSTQFTEKKILLIFTIALWPDFCNLTFLKLPGISYTKDGEMKSAHSKRFSSTAFIFRLTVCD